MSDTLLCCCPGHYEGCNHGRGLASCSEPVDEDQTAYWCKGCNARRIARQSKGPTMMNAEQLAQFFHETYTRLAPEYDRKPHLDPKPWAAVPEPNKSLLIAVAREMLFTLYGEGFIKWQKQSEYLVEAGIQAAEQARICACGHAVSEHMNLPASDGTPLLMCVASSSCGDTETVDGFIKRCSIPTEVTG